jgi:phage tail protein X
MSTAPTITEVVQIEGLRLSQVIWRRFKRQPVGYIERVLGINPGISANIDIPVGTRVKLPLDLPTEALEPDVVRLWD